MCPFICSAFSYGNNKPKCVKCETIMTIEPYRTTLPIILYFSEVLRPAPSGYPLLASYFTHRAVQILSRHHTDYVVSGLVSATIGLRWALCACRVGDC